MARCSLDFLSFLAGFAILRDAPFTPCYRGGYFLDLLPDVCDEARTQMVGRGTELPHPLRCSTSSIRNIQSMRALGGVLSGGTLPEEPVYATMAI